MSTINDLLSILSEDEQSQFVRYLGARNRRTDVRNIELFKALLNGKEGGLKSEMGSNAYNVLRNRLKHRMIDFIAQSTLQKEGSTEDEMTKTFITARRLLKEMKTESAFKLLLKLEMDTRKLELYALEGEIQQLLIEYAHLSGAPNLDELYERSTQNHQLQRARTNLNLAYARIRMAYQQVEFEGESIDLATLLNETFEEFAISDEVAYGFSSLHQLVQLADIHGAYSKNYHEINLFFIDKLHDLQLGASDTELNSHYHIEILYAIANIYFRKKDFETSAQFLTQMKEQMERFKVKSAVHHELKWRMLSALNSNHIGDFQMAREHIETVLAQKIPSDDTIQIRLALAMLQIQQGELRECQRTLSKFSHTDAWYEKNLGIEWTLHKLTLEVLLHIDLENYDYAESRLKSLLRKYKDYLNSEGKSQARPFLRLIQAILREPSVVESPEFHETVETSIQWKKAEEEDVFRINFYAWLKGKMTRKAAYTTLLELLNTEGSINE